MSLNVRTGEHDANLVSEVLSLQRVVRHRGSPQEFVERFRKKAKLIPLFETQGLGEIAPNLVHLISDERTLRVAWDHLEANGGQAPGPDGARYGDYPDRVVWQHCRGLRDSIRDGTYEPSVEKVRRIPKNSGKGYRPLVLQSIFDRVVQRAAVEILQPLLDPCFSKTSFGFRPGRGPMDALAAARAATLKERRRVWLVADIRDAFGTVPVNRLLNVVQKYLPSAKLTDFVSLMLSGAKLPGLRQGGPLSPLLLNLYLHHLLDRKWREIYPGIQLIRYADDMLVTCRSREEASRCYDGLVNLLRPAGFSLKESREEAIRHLDTGEKADYMGFRIGMETGELRFGLNSAAWQSLAESLIEAQHASHPPLRAVQAICGWVDQKGACYRDLDRDSVYARVRQAAREQGFEEIVYPSEFEEVWERSHERWKDICDRTGMPISTKVGGACR